MSRGFRLRRRGSGCGCRAHDRQPRPQRIRQSRRKGADIHWLGREANGLPTRSVAYTSRWHNPFTVKEHGRAEAIRLFCEYVADQHDAIRRNLRGFNLACVCRLDEACHADVLLAIAND